MLKLNQLLLRIIFESYGLGPHYDSKALDTNIVGRFCARKYKSPQENQDPIGLMPHTDRTVLSIVYLYARIQSRPGFGILHWTEERNRERNKKMENSILVHEMLFFWIRTRGESSLSFDELVTMLNGEELQLTSTTKDDQSTILVASHSGPTTSRHDSTSVSSQPTTNVQFQVPSHQQNVTPLVPQPSSQQFYPQQQLYTSQYRDSNKGRGVVVVDFKGLLVISVAEITIPLNIVVIGQIHLNRPMEDLSILCNHKFIPYQFMVSNIRLVNNLSLPPYSVSNGGFSAVPSTPLVNAQVSTQAPSFAGFVGGPVNAPVSTQAPPFAGFIGGPAVAYTTSSAPSSSTYNGPSSSGMSTSGAYSGNQWFFDSGATNHVTHNLQNIDQPQISTMSDRVVVGNEQAWGNGRLHPVRHRNLGETYRSALYSVALENLYLTGRFEESLHIVRARFPVLLDLASVVGDVVLPSWIMDWWAEERDSRLVDNKLESNHLALLRHLVKFSMTTSEWALRSGHCGVGTTEWVLRSETSETMKGQSKGSNNSHKKSKKMVKTKSVLKTREKGGCERSSKKGEIREMLGKEFWFQALCFGGMDNFWQMAREFRGVRKGPPNPLLGMSEAMIGDELDLTDVYRFRVERGDYPFSNVVWKSYV
ncbi:hypothetical protein Vadar_033572 [Vaccinium darrowii]|uniref:Uncharacterized protein n=1 Tax=Vaccinium darrowii TaxID=229202 RepID=A0ACB7X606_9ERIC|nr:hypothetical protein Vadar_033572 [Vaccinium darrowii]